MLYKVTPQMTPSAEAEVEAPAPKTRKRRKTAIFDGDGHEVLITLMCLKCRSMKPLAQFGLRKMSDGAIRNQPWCRPCRSQAGTKPRKPSDALVQLSPALTPEPLQAAPADAAAVELHDASANSATLPAELSAVFVSVDAPASPARAEDESTQPMAQRTQESSEEVALPLVAERGPDSF